MSYSPVESRGPAPSRRAAANREVRGEVLEGALAPSARQHGTCGYHAVATGGTSPRTLALAQCHLDRVVGLGCPGPEQTEEVSSGSLW
jgi:hypothetical protein